MLIGQMLSLVIKRIAHRIYQAGYFEHLRREQSRRDDALRSAAYIEQNVWISNEAVISNSKLPNDRLKIGKNSRVMGNLSLFDFSGTIEVGEDCFIGPQTRIWSAKSIKIGNRVLIAHNVNIHDNISHPIDARDRYLENKEFVMNGFHSQTDLNSKEIVIEDDVWIGFNSTILKGVKIGQGAIIGAGSMVLNDVEPWTVNVGNPLRVVRRLEPVKVV